MPAREAKQSCDEVVRVIEIRECDEHVNRNCRLDEESVRKGDAKLHKFKGDQCEQND